METGRAQFVDEGRIGLNHIMTILNNLSAGLQKSPITDEQVRASMVKDLDNLRKRTRFFSALARMQEDFDAEVRTEAEEDEEAVDVAKLFKNMVEKEAKEERTHQEYWSKFDYVRQLMLYNPENPATAVPSGTRHGAAEEEEDIIMETNDVVLRMLDPITKNRIIDPVKNKVCQHIYDRAAVLAYIKDNRQRNMLCQCPQPGCKNKAKLTEKDLEDYKEFFERAAL